MPPSAAEGVSGYDLLQRHQSGDWGELPTEDRKENRRALKAGLRIFSSYRLANTQTRLWIITEHDRSLTTLLLPQEY